MECLSARIRSAISAASHGDLPKWRSLLENLPELPVSGVVLNEDRVRVESAQPLDPERHEALYGMLQKLHPWRKGPYQIHGIHIDSEWRSDLKWNRLDRHISPLANRRVLDVGCGNGYHCWRMLGAGARLVIGIDPTLISVVQFRAIRHFVGESPVFVLPLSAEGFPVEISGFDTVFSMGVLYHRKSPLDHLNELRGFLRSGGELVLETLVVDGGDGYTLLPEDRYAMMRNVWFIPSCPTLSRWLKRAGFNNIRLIDVTATTSAEQRSTAWMRFQSLPEFLDPNDRNLTREGLPAPKRAIFIANTP
ncbi:MAG: tRNA 5-methoxyuridine(34)/uridine 5-oxyacetic acid(34) synthase CmoB [Methylococcaceae bacterium]|nr:tRNA 5-methoxyuridine(34)/uridine 5-oxyacetic acid(34) synthase CmoB [Methylococcaceae bacterium]MCI0732238.1 tRNA 5-methoxyuridine(34)/uridine 5-oxyacetic acid(34) synthase CmoB [Methylococcaceae bacterium]